MVWAALSNQAVLHRVSVAVQKFVPPVAISKETRKSNHCQTLIAGIHPFFLRGSSVGFSATLEQSQNRTLSSEGSQARDSLSGSVGFTSDMLAPVLPHPGLKSTCVALSQVRQGSYRAASLLRPVCSNPSRSPLRTRDSTETKGSRPVRPSEHKVQDHRLCAHQLHHRRAPIDTLSKVFA